MGQTILDMRQKEQELQMSKQHQLFPTALTSLSPGDLVYMLCPHLSKLKTGTKKFRKTFIGPLAVGDILDNCHVTLFDITTDKLINGSHHLKRLKRAYLRLPNGQSISHISKIREYYGQANRNDKPTTDDDK